MIYLGGSAKRSSKGTTNGEIKPRLLGNIATLTDLENRLNFALQNLSSFGTTTAGTDRPIQIVSI